MHGSSLHHHSDQAAQNSLKKVLVLSIMVTTTQFVGSFLANSLSLLSDAAHNGADMLSLGLSWWALRLRRQQVADSKRTFAFARAELMAASFNGVSLILLGMGLIQEAKSLVGVTREIHLPTVLFMSLLGLSFNGISLKLMESSSHHNWNLRSAYWHMLSDFLTSLAVGLGAIAMAIWNIPWLDQALCFFLSLLFIFWGVKILKELFPIFMQFVPAHYDLDKILATTAANYPEIKLFSHVHLWKFTEEKVYFQCKIHMDEKEVSLISFLKKLEEDLTSQYHFDHVSLFPVAFEGFEPEECGYTFSLEKKS